MNFDQVINPQTLKWCFEVLKLTAKASEKATYSALTCKTKSLFLICILIFMKCHCF
jgi:hypothetical protein